MGKLYLASYQFKKPHNGELVDEKRLIHADIKEGSEFEKCSILTDWLEDWFKMMYPDVELTGAKVNPTIDLVAKDEEPAPKKEPLYSGIKYQKLDQILSDTDHSVYFVRNNDPENAVIAGYGGTYGEALLDFAKRLEKSGYRLNDKFEFEFIKD